MQKMFHAGFPVRLLRRQLHSLKHDPRIWRHCHQFVADDMSGILSLPGGSHDSIIPLCEVEIGKAHEHWGDLNEFHGWRPEHEENISVRHHQLFESRRSVVVSHSQCQGHAPNGCLIQHHGNSMLHMKAHDCIAHAFWIPKDSFVNTNLNLDKTNSEQPWVHVLKPLN